jgi:hypothetical protein
MKTESKTETKKESKTNTRLGYKLKMVVSFVYLVSLFAFIEFIFNFTPLSKLAYINSLSTSDIFLNQLSSFVIYMIVIVFFVMLLNSLRRYRKVMEFQEIKSKNPNDPRVHGFVDPRGCGIWNPTC